MRDEKGFTMIELVMVIVILGVMSIVAIPKYIDMQKEALMAAGDGCLGAMQSALVIHQADHYLRGTPWVKNGQELMDKLMSESSEMPEGITYDSKSDRWIMEGESGYVQFYPADDKAGKPPRVVLVTKDK